MLFGWAMEGQRQLSALLVKLVRSLTQICKVTFRSSVRIQRFPNLIFQKLRYIIRLVNVRNQAIIGFLGNIGLRNGSGTLSEAEEIETRVTRLLYDRILSERT
ncbi:hypothetical protein ACKWTF_001027 [Chironomus riparius]